MTDDRGLYLYAVVPADTHIDGVPPGVGDRQSDLIRHEDLGLVAHEVDLADLARLNEPSADPGQLAELAQRHDRVVRAAMEAATAVLPFRLGTVLADRQSARQFLVERWEDLRRGLGRLTNCEEWGVTVRAEGSSEPQQTRSGSTPDRPGTAYLTRRRQQLDDAESRRRTRSARAAEIDEALHELSVDSAHGPKRGVTVLLDETYLVRRPETSAFLDAVDRCGARLCGEGIELRLTGPWPPYSFARLEGCPD